MFDQLITLFFSSNNLCPHDGFIKEPCIRKRQTGNIRLHPMLIETMEKYILGRG